MEGWGLGGFLDLEWGVCCYVFVRLVFLYVGRGVFFFEGALYV